MNNDLHAIKSLSKPTPFTPFLSLSSINSAKNSGDLPLRLRKCSTSYKEKDQYIKIYKQQIQVSYKKLQPFL